MEITDKDSPFYKELVAIMSESNRARPDEDRVSFRRAVMEGLGLRDSFTGKIRSGTYKPTIDRIRNLATLLKVRPSRFDEYVRRYAREQIDTDPNLLEVFRKLSDLDPRIAESLTAGINDYVTKVLTKARSAA